MRVLITGATGFVGRTLVPYLYKNGITEIAVLVRSIKKAEYLFGDLPLTVIETADPAIWREAVIDYNADVVLHLAALFNTRCDQQSATDIVNSNILFTTHLLEAVSQTSCSHFVNIGTFTEFLYGSGEYFANNLYSASKTAVRPILKYYQSISSFHWVNVVVYSPYGRKNESKKVIDYMVDALDSPTLVNFSKGEQILDFIHVDDMADFFYTLISKRDRLVYNFTELHLGAGAGHSIREVASEMERVFGKSISANWGGLPYRAFDAMYAVAPIAKSLELLNWRAKLSLREGLEIFKESLEVEK
ncbi:MAG: NAD(P)-dependent oxidoreductase [Rikenellaceae bacterium]